MSWLSRLSVRAKLGLLVAVFSAGMVLVTVLSFWGLNQAVAASQSMVAGEMQAVQWLGDTRAAVGNARRYEKDLFLNLAEEDKLKAYQKSWAAELDRLNATLERLKPLLDTEQQASADQMSAAVGRYRQTVQGIVQRIEMGEINDPWAANKALEPAKGEIRSADEALTRIGASVTRRVDATAQALVDLQRQVVLRTLAIALAALGSAIWLGWIIARHVTGPLQQAARAIERVAQGDLSERVHSLGQDEIARVMQGIDAMQSALVRVVAQIRQGVDTVVHASEEIASGNHDLSARTESAASSLQQTAASMEELNSTMRQSADAARQASQMAVANAQVAARGGQVVGQVVATMDEINHSSKKINDIIGVIDGIAFQTNILALNAAVEAARAGEQGRGFAVVAAEVRNLAQRSAEAAKEIKGLIGTSVDKVEAGTRLVAEAGSTIGEVVANAQRVADIIGEITAASGEQSSGIGQVNTAVNHLDQMVQQNAALVEESSAAAESLKSQAEQLSQAVRVFKTARV
jgi:methyl-accepting chemotaxis protein